MGWHGLGWGMGGWAWPVMGLFWLIIIVLMVLAIRWLVPGINGGGQPDDSTRNEALAILDERLAHGEIDVAEYEERKRALRAKR